MILQEVGGTYTSPLPRDHAHLHTTHPIAKPQKGPHYHTCTPARSDQVTPLHDRSPNLTRIIRHDHHNPHLPSMITVVMWPSCTLIRHRNHNRHHHHSSLNDANVILNPLQLLKNSSQNEKENLLHFALLHFALTIYYILRQKTVTICVKLNLKSYYILRRLLQFAATRYYIYYNLR